MEKSKSWLYVSFGALALSIASLFLPVISYTAGQGKDSGTHYSYNLIGLITDKNFAVDVLGDTDRILMEVSPAFAVALVLVLCIVGVAAIACSVIGLSSMSRQYESAWPFRLTLAGIVCTAVPAVAILVTCILAGNWLAGTIAPGAYVFVTPVAMVISVVTVTRRHRLTREELQIQEAARAYIRPAGDLPVQ